MPTCPSCHSQFREGKFCLNCGDKLTEETASESDSPTAILQALLVEFPGIVSDGKLLEALLRDVMPHFEQDRNLLALAQRFGIPQELQKKTALDLVDLNKLANLLATKYCIEREASRRTVLCWAQALGLDCGAFTSNAGAQPVFVASVAEPVEALPSNASSTRLGHSPYQYPTESNSQFEFTATEGGYTLTRCLSAASSIVIPSQHSGYPVTAIGPRAFANCYDVVNVIVPDTVVEIGEWAFSHCSSLSAIKIPDSVVSIGDWAFNKCGELTVISLPQGLRVIEKGTFSYCSSLVFLMIPDKVTRIGDWAFSYCISLTSMTIPASVTNIGKSAFNRCSSLTQVTLPFQVIVDKTAFESCTATKVYR